MLNRAVNWFRPGHAGGIWLLGLFSAALAILGNVDQTRAALWPPNWDLNAPWSGYGISFVLLTIASVAYLLWESALRKRNEKEEAAKNDGFRQRMVDEQVKLREEQEKSRVAQQDLATLQKAWQDKYAILPESGFLGNFDEMNRRAFMPVTLLLENRKGRTAVTPEEAVYNIRFLLFAVSNLVRSFEKSPRDTVYSANVMFYHAKSTLKGALLLQLKRHIRFTENGLNLPDLDGVLDLQPELTATTIDPLTVRPDDAVHRVALPVRLEFASSGHSLSIPGAPRAFHTNGMDVMHDVHQMGQRCIEETVASAYVKEAMDIFFKEEQARHIRSFMSIPILRSTDVYAPLGVVNVNCSRVGLLELNEQRELLLPHLRSLLWPLPELLDSYALATRRRQPWCDKYAHRTVS